MRLRGSVPAQRDDGIHLGGPERTDSGFTDPQCLVGLSGNVRNQPGVDRGSQGVRAPQAHVSKADLFTSHAVTATLPS